MNCVSDLIYRERLLDKRSKLFAFASSCDEESGMNSPGRSGPRLVNGGGNYVNVRLDHGAVDRGHK